MDISVRNIYCVVSLFYLILCILTCLRNNWTYFYPHT